MSNNFEGMQEVKRPVIKFGKVGDWCRGILVSKDRQIENKLSGKGDMQTIIELKVQGGSFHNIENKVVDSTPTIPEVGEIYSIFVKQFMADQLKNVALGTVIGFNFVETKKASQPGFNDTKIVKLLVGQLDPNYQGE